MPSLNGRQRRFLRSLGHHLKPVVTVGSGGPTTQVLAQVDTQLTAHELIKIKVLEGDREELQTVARSLGAGSHSEIAQVMGRTVLLYRPHPKRPAIVLPA